MIIAPEPAEWLTCFDQLPVFAPWASTGTTPSWLPRRVRAFRNRRSLEHAVAVPGFALVEGMLRMWAGERADAKLATRFALRRGVDGLASVWIRRNLPAVVVAPSLCARRSFVAAREIGARCVLVEDLPDLRSLHADLDRAARAYPDSRFLLRYRAPASAIADQEVERVLADEIWLRGHYALALRVAAGIPESKLRLLPAPSCPPLARGNGQGAVLLAGLAAARHGTHAALALLDAIPEMMLLVRTGEGAEPAKLLRHPRVAEYRGQGVDGVIAPALCESYPHELGAASAAGIPAIATQRAAGPNQPHIVGNGDLEGLVRAVREQVMDCSR